MNNDEKIDQESIDKLLATANLELADLPTDVTDSNIKEPSISETASNVSELPTTNEADKEPNKQERKAPLLLLKSLKGYSPSKKILIIITFYLLFITGGAFLGFKLTQKTIEENPPLDKIIELGITFEEKSMVTYAGRGEQEIVTAFIEAGMPIDSIRSTDGWTPLIAASFFKKTALVEQLLEQHAAVNIQDKYGKTPLMYAAAMGAEDIVKVLLSTGANPNIQDKNGRTALMEAYSKQQAKIAEILKTAGADPNLQPITKTEEQAALSTAIKEQNTSKPSSVPEETQLSVGKVGLVKIGMSIEDLQKKYTNIIIKDQYINGTKKAFATIYLTNKNSPSLKIELTSGKPQLVSSINTYDEQFTTEKNINIKSTVGDICDQYLVSDIKVIDNSLFLVVKSMKMLFELDTKDEGFTTAWFETNNPQSIPSSTKITRIINY
jgi:hypothetical protein